MRHPLVSIITPCYNGEKYLKKLLESILEQDYSPIELIIVNDGSTDGSLDILKKYIPKFKKKDIKYIILSKNNGGLVSAINMGLKEFSGDYINFIGQDDYFTDGSIKKRVDYLEENKDIDVVWGASNIVDGNSGEVTEVWKEINTPPRKNLFDDMILHRDYIWPPAAKLVRSSTFLRLNPTRNLSEFDPGENIQIFLPIYYKGNNVGYIDEPLAYVTSHNDSYSRKYRSEEETKKYQNEIRDIFIDTLNKINMSDDERNKYIHIVKERYAQFNDDVTPINTHKKLHISTYIYTVVRSMKRILRPRTRTRSYLKKINSVILRRVYAFAMLKKMKYTIHSWIQSRKRWDGAILTLSGYFNYGNIIQRYALQEFLRRNNHNFVSYFDNPDNVDDASFGSSRNALKSFVKRHIDVKYPNVKDNYSAYIVGSDQIWRNWDYKNEKNDLGYYFLDFIKKSDVTKIAYAASFGVDTTEEAHISSSFIKYIQPFLSQFSAIGMRESSGVEMVKKTWDISSRQVLDPTMLLSKDDYNYLIDVSPYRLHKTSKIFAYILGISDKESVFVDKISEETGYSLDKFYPRQMTELPPVEQWLQGFRDADLIITDSFHGAVFSIINNTAFIVRANTDGGVARITSLLEQFGLEDRLVTEDSINNFHYDTLESIDWGKVNKKLDILKKDSENWLLSALEVKI